MISDHLDISTDDVSKKFISTSILLKNLISFQCQRKCIIVHHMYNICRKAEYQYRINAGCEYMKSHNPKKAWKWLKTTAKVDKFKNMSNFPVEDKNGKLVTSTKEQLEVRHDHYKKLASSHSDINSSLIECF